MTGSWRLKTDARYDEEVVIDEVVTPADRVDASRVLTLLVGLALVAYLVIHYADGGTATLDIVNWTFLALIFLLVRSPLELIALTKNAASNVGEILLQFPLYAGIMGIMATSGLITVFSDFIVDTAGPSTFGVLAFLSAGVVNFFVPSGGGQFAVQGPVMLDAGARLGVDPSVDDHGDRLRRPVDQHDPALLGAAGAGHLRAQDPRHPRLHPGDADRLRSGLRHDHAARRRRLAAHSTGVA